MPDEMEAATMSMSCPLRLSHMTSLKELREGKSREANERAADSLFPSIDRLVHMYLDLK